MKCVKILSLILTININLHFASNAPKISIWGIKYDYGLGNYGIGKINKTLISNEFNIEVKVFENGDELIRWKKDYPYPDFAVKVGSSQISEFFNRIYIQCEWERPVKWIYQSEGHPNSELLNERLIYLSANKTYYEYIYRSSMVFGISNIFLNKSSGKYICTERWTTLSLNPSLVNSSYIWVNVVNSTEESRNLASIPNLSSECKSPTVPEQNLQLFYKEEEGLYHCCSSGFGDPKNLLLIRTRCDTPDACEMNRNCANPDNSCIGYYNGIVYTNELDKACVQTTRREMVPLESNGKSNGELQCRLGQFCVKKMGYTFKNGKNVLIPVPMTQENIDLKAKDVLRGTSEIISHYKELKKCGELEIHHSKCIEKALRFRCEGPHFYLEYGFIWALVFRNGSSVFMTGIEGVFRDPDEVYETLTLNWDPNDSSGYNNTLAKVICIAPLLNSPGEWINITILIPNVDSSNILDPILTDSDIASVGMIRSSSQRIDHSLVIKSVFTLTFILSSIKN